MSGTNFEVQHVLKSQILHIRSEDGRGFLKDTSGDVVKTGFTIDLFEAISCQLNQTFLVSLSSIEFPYSFYTTDSTNNELKMKVQNTDTSAYSSVYSVLIPVGNYNANNLKSKLKSMLDTQFHSNTVGATLATSFSITYDDVSNKFTFKTSESNRKGIMTWSSAAPTNPINKQLGFTGDDDVDFTSTAGASSDAVVNVGGSRTDALYIRTTLGSNNSIESRIRGVSSILQKVPVSTPPNSFIFFDAAQVSAKLQVPTKSIQSVSVRITDAEDRLINTNNINFSISIQFDTIETPKFSLPHPARRMGEEASNFPYFSNRFQTVEEIRHKNLMERLREAPKHTKVKKRERQNESGNSPQTATFETQPENIILRDNIEEK